MDGGRFAPRRTQAGASRSCPGDPRLARPLLGRLRAVPELVIGESQPYPGQHDGDTLWSDGTARGLAHAIVEVRQDLIGCSAGQQAWGKRLARLLRQMLADDAAGG